MRIGKETGEAEGVAGAEESYQDSFLAMRIVDLRDPGKQDVNAIGRMLLLKNGLPGAETKDAAFAEKPANGFVGDPRNSLQQPDLIRVG